MNDSIDRPRIASLIRQIDRFPSALPAGLMMRRIREYGEYEEDGLVFRPEDAVSGRVYVGLAALARDMHFYLAQHPEQYPESEVAVFTSAVDDVRTVDGRQYGNQAFPDYLGLPEYQVAALPTGLAESAAEGNPNVEGLDSQEIVHEWTFKPGKRLLISLVSRFGAACQEVVCGDLQERLKEGSLQSQALNVAVATMLVGGLATSAFWIPLAAYVGLGVAKHGLAEYCKLEDQKGRLLIPARSW